MRIQLFIICISLLLPLMGRSQVEITLKKTITDNFLESEIIQEVSYSALQYDKIGMISPDMELRVDNDNYFILDNKFTQCVYHFNRDGELLNTICEQKPAGSGDNLPVLNNPAKFNVNPFLEQVEIYNFEKSIVQRFTYQGKKIDQIPFPINPADFTRDENGNYWIYTGWNNKETQFRLLKADKNGKIIDRQLRLVTKCTPVESFAFSYWGNKILLCELLGNSTYMITNNAAKESYFLNYGIMNLSPVFHTMNAYDSYQMLNHNGYYTIKKYLENDHFAYFFLNFNSTEQRDMYHIIYDKKTKKLYQYTENAGIGAFDKAQALTADDELIFMVTPRKIRQLSASTYDVLPPAFDELNEVSKSTRNTMVVRIKLQSPGE